MTTDDHSIHDAVRDSLAPSSAAKSVIDWAARYRTTTTEVQRYSRFVVFMKRALPMAAAALLAAVVAYSVQPRLQDSKKLALTLKKVGILSNDLMMTKPRLTGVDGNGDPYVVTAERAVQDPHDGKRAQLRNVEADVTLKSGDWLNATAAVGLLDTSQQKLWLKGGIGVYSDSGYEVHTQSANVDIKTSAIVGNNEATGQGPMGTFRCDRFRIEREGKGGAKYDAKQAVKGGSMRIYLSGNVRMTIFKHGAGHR